MVNNKLSKQVKSVLIILGTIISLVLVEFFTPAILGLFSKDIPPIDDSDITLKKVIVLDNENAYFDLMDLEHLIYDPEDVISTINDVFYEDIWDEDSVKEVIISNEKALRKFKEASQKPKYQHPIIANPENITPYIILPSTYSWRRAAQLSALQAIYLSKQGYHVEAIEEAFKSIEMGQKIQNSQVSLFEYMVAVAIKRIGLHALQEVIILSDLSGSEMYKYTEKLSPFYENKEGLINAFKMEYHQVSWAIEGIADDSKEEAKEIKEDYMGGYIKERRIRSSHYFQPNKTKLLFANHFRADIEGVKQLCGEAEGSQLEWVTIPGDFFDFHIRENSIGRILFSITSVSLMSANRVRCEESLMVSITQTMMGIKGFKNDNERYPDALGELVPHYLSSIPIDPFDEKPLRYSAEEKILYSVGEIMEDLGGSSGDEWRRMPNPTFKVDF